MAKREHLRILQKGPQVWNQWRKEHPRIKPRLKRANLTQANLVQADLSNTDLWGASIINADLRGARLNGAMLGRAQFFLSRLDEADLTGAAIYHAKVFHSTFIGANLTRARFNHAKLEYVSLDSADLTGADFQSADVRGVDFNNANLAEVELGSTLFISCNFRQARALDLVKHHKASIISIDTIYNLKGSIPDKFLEGSGVPRDFIQHLRAQDTLPDQFRSCFISYSSKDREFAERLYIDLQQRGVKCWFAPEDLKVGDRFRDIIEESIRNHDKLLIILSKNSVGSRWVEREVYAALELEDRHKRNILLPIQLDEALVRARKAWASEIRRERHVGKFQEWRNNEAYKKALAELFRVLKAEKPS